MGKRVPLYYIDDITYLALKKAMKKKFGSQAKYAEKIKMSAGQLSNILVGRESCSKKLRSRFFKDLGVMFEEQDLKKQEYVSCTVCGGTEDLEQIPHIIPKWIKDGDSYMCPLCQKESRKKEWWEV